MIETHGGEDFAPAQKVFVVSSAGPQTFYLLALNVSGGTEPLIFKATLTLFILSDGVRAGNY